MKKRIISLAFAVLMMLTILPAAANADQIMSLPQATAGTPLTQVIAKLASGETVLESTPLPTGCELKVDTSLGEVALVGTPTVPGKYSFTLTIGSSDGFTVTNTVTCSLDVLPATPVINTSGSVNCYIGGEARLTVAASTADNGQLTYQWYLSPSGSTSGGTLLPGATGPEYMANTASVGTSYYYCVVTNTSGGATASAVSAPILVNVTQPVVSSIMINTIPSKTRYIVGESIDTTGLSLVVNYGDGTQQVISSGFNVFPTIFTSAGTVAVELTYGGKSCSLPVTVMTEEESIQGIGVVVMPHKTTYKQGEQLDTTGLVFRVYLADGTYTDIDSGYSYAPRVLSNSGTQEITLTYKNKTCTFPVTVEASQEASTLEIASSPGKLVYNVGDSLDTSGLVLKLGDKLITSGFTCEPSVLSTAGSQAVRVRYGSMMTTFTVTVNSGSSSPSPTVSPSASPSPTSSVTPSVSPSAAPEKHSGSKNGVLVVIMIIALLCLIALGMYMLIMNAGGVEQFRNQLEYKLYKIKSRFRRRGR